MPSAPVWTGTDIAVAMHWAKWLPFMGLVAALTFMAGMGAVAGVGLPFTIGALVVLTTLLFGAGWPAVAALRTGFLLRLDAAGVHARGQVIPWREVQALAVETRHLKIRRSDGGDVAVPLLFARFDPDVLPHAVRVSSQFWKACRG